MAKTGQRERVSREKRGSKREGKVFLFLLSFCCVAAVDPLSLLSLSLARLQPKPPLRQNNAAGSNPKASSDEAKNRRATEPFADDVRRLRELRRAERAAAASAPPHQRLAALARRLWLQYLITWAAYCFDWWERLVVHACLITVAGLMLYGVSLGARAARAAAAAAAGVALGGGSGGSTTSRGGNLFGASLWPWRR